MNHWLMLLLPPLFVALPGVVAAPSAGTAYDLPHPTVTYRMPAALRELSGIAVLANRRVACVEDQTGTIYIYSLDTRCVVQTIPFGPPGDYEDLVQVGQDWYVLRSDGTLFKRRGSHTTAYPTGLSTANEPEGLAYDASSNSLLVACKGAAGVGSSDQFRAVYRLAPGTFRHDFKPAYVLDVAQLMKANPAVNRFAPSAVAIHPKTGHIFVAAASGNALVELDARGQVVRVDKLPRALFPQPEGLSFAPSGDLYIGSEAGHTQTALLQVIAFQPLP